MKVATYEGIVEDGSVRLPDDVNLPEKTKVYIVVPTVEAQPVAHLRSPRLAHPDQMAHFRKEVIEDLEDAGV
jgi:hypothetical protein